MILYIIEVENLRNKYNPNNQIKKDGKIDLDFFDLTFKIQGARDNLGILFEPNFQFLIPGLSLETTEQGESY